MSFVGKVLLGILVTYLPQHMLEWDWRTKVTVSVKDQPLQTVCEMLEAQYGIRFSYSRDVVDLSHRVTVAVHNKPLKQTLEDLFSPFDIQFARIGGQIVLTIKKGPVYTISGYVEDLNTGERLIGATVYAPAQQAGTTTNQFGFFSITLPKDTTALQISYIGYMSQQQPVTGIAKKEVVIPLRPVNSLQEVVVKENQQSRLQEQMQMSRLSISPTDVRSMPRLLGEADVMRTITALPGVSGGIDLGNGLNVRGGSPDQNLILLDGTPIFNTSHLFGLFSVFNPDIVKSMSLYKGAFPARYGGRLSSVVDIAMKDGDMKAYHGEASIGLIAAKFMVEGPLVKDKTSFIVSARRSHLNLLMEDLLAENFKGEEGNAAGLYFYDVNVKINHIFSPRDRIYLSAYAGEDNLSLKREGNETDVSIDRPYTEKTKLQFGWGNLTSTLRWNHIFNPRLFSNATINYSRYFFLTDYTYDYKTININDAVHQYGKYSSRIENIVGKMDFDYMPDPHHTIKFGVGVTKHIFKPGVSVFEDNTATQLPVDTIYNNTTSTGQEMLVYAEDNWVVTPSLHLNLGLHASAFWVDNRYYNSLQPRMGACYLLPHNWSLKFSFTHMNQYLHLLTSNGTSLPTDLWVPSTKRVKPMYSKQVSLGVVKTAREKMYSFSLEGYYKTMDNVIEYKENTSVFNTAFNKWDETVAVGKGNSYGGELLLEKKTGNTRGWIGYTMAWSNREFPDVNNGKAFPYKYDRRHDLEVVIAQKLGKRWEMSASWEYSSGIPLTLPVASYEGINDPSPYDPPANMPIQDHIGERNQFRSRDMHRLDLSFTYSKKKKWWIKSWTFSVYNTYNKQNPFFYTIVTDREKQERYLAEISILPILPSVTYAIKF